MKNVTRQIAFVSTLVALASLGSAQVLNGAANAAGQVKVPAMQPPPPPPPPSVSAGGSAGAVSAASTTVRPPVMPANAAASTAGQATGSASPSTGVNANATSNASAQGQANGLSVATAVPSQASVTVNTADTVHTIQTCNYASRDSVTAEVQARLDASVQQCTAMQAKAEAAGQKSREAFAKALVEVRKQEKELRASLRAAAKASGEKAWGETQSALAHDYSAYAEAMAHAEAAAQGSGEVAAASKP